MTKHLLLLLLLQATYLRTAKVNHIGESEAQLGESEAQLGESEAQLGESEAQLGKSEAWLSVAIIRLRDSSITLTKMIV